MGLRIFPDPVAYEVGNRTDAANPAGSLHAKVTDVKNAIAELVQPVNWHQKTPTLSTAAVDGTSLTGEATLLEITGNRLILGGQIISWSDSTSESVRVYIDGTKVIDKACSVLEDYLSAPEALKFHAQSTSGHFWWAIPIPPMLHFAYSFKVTSYYQGGVTAVRYLAVAVWHVPA